MRVLIDGEPWRRTTGEGGRMIARVLYTLDDLDEIHFQFVHGGHDGWDEFLRLVLDDPDDADLVTWCIDCATPVLDENTRWVEERNHEGFGGSVCDSCIDANYYPCEDCYEYVVASRAHDVATSVYRWVCGSCRENWSYCDDCEQWYRHDNESHDHDEDPDDDVSTCEVPHAAQNFTFGVGIRTIGSDTPTTVALPEGIITDQGLDAMRTYLWRVARDYQRGGDTVTWDGLYSAAYWVENIEPIWQTDEGNWTRRFQRYVYKHKDKFKIPSMVLSELGNIAHAHSAGGELTVEFSRDLNASPRFWYHEDSCWWQSYSYSRCTLKSNGGLGIRTFGYPEAQYPNGRAWIIPLKDVTQPGGPVRLAPTFNTAADAYVVFNGYGALEGFAMARVVAAFAEGYSYKKVECHGEWEMYNNGDGYLVAPQATLDALDAVRLVLSRHSDLYEDEQIAAQIDQPVA